MIICSSDKIKGLKNPNETIENVLSIEKTILGVYNKAKGGIGEIECIRVTIKGKYCNEHIDLLFDSIEDRDAAFEIFKKQMEKQDELRWFYNGMPKMIYGKKTIEDEARILRERIDKSKQYGGIEYGVYTGSICR
jgi:hypothetical protein